jgi:hypothetical protein
MAKSREQADNKKERHGLFWGIVLAAGALIVAAAGIDLAE